MDTRLVLDRSSDDEEGSQADVRHLF
jgi:hypothetical protein